MGASTAEEVSELCRLACSSDHARADCAGVDLEFPYQIGQGDDHCELVFTRKAESESETSGIEAARVNAGRSKRLASEGEAE